jgi:hypothetical protein
MTFDTFNNECLGIVIQDWPHMSIGMFMAIDVEWGKLSPIPTTNPLSKEWACVDSDLYIRLDKIKLIKHIKYAEKLKQETKSIFDDNSPGKSAIG